MMELLIRAYRLYESLTAKRQTFHVADYFHRIDEKGTT